MTHNTFTEREEGNSAKSIRNDCSTFLVEKYTELSSTQYIATKKR